MTTQTPPSGLLQRLAQGSLVKQILIGLVLGVLLALVRTGGDRRWPARYAVRRRAESRSAGAGADAGDGLHR